MAIVREAMSVTAVCMCAVRHGPSSSEHFSLVCLVLHASLNTEWDVLFLGVLSATPSYLSIHPYVQLPLLDWVMCQSQVTCPQVYIKANIEARLQERGFFLLITTKIDEQTVPMITKNGQLHLKVDDEFTIWPYIYKATEFSINESVWVHEAKTNVLIAGKRGQCHKPFQTREKKICMSSVLWNT